MPLSAWTLPDPHIWRDLAFLPAKEFLFRNLPSFLPLLFKPPYFELNN